MSLLRFAREKKKNHHSPPTLSKEESQDRHGFGLNRSKTRVLSLLSQHSQTADRTPPCLLVSNSNHILIVYLYKAHKAVIDSSAIPRANVAKATRRNGFAFVHMWVAVLSIHTHISMLLKDKQPSRQGSEDAHRTCMHVSDSSPMQASPSVSLAIYYCHTFDN